MRAGGDRQGPPARECLTPSTQSCCVEGRSGGLAAGSGKEPAFVIRHWIAARDSEAIDARSEDNGELVRNCFHSGASSFSGCWSCWRGAHRAKATAGRHEGSQDSQPNGSVALADVTGLLGFPGMESINLGRKRFPTNSARVRDRERSDRRCRQTRRIGPIPCEYQLCESQLLVYCLGSSCAVTLERF